MHRVAGVALLRWEECTFCGSWWGGETGVDGAAALVFAGDGAVVGVCFGEVRHAERRVEGSSSVDGGMCERADDGLASSQAVPFHLFVLADGLHHVQPFLFLDSLRLFDFQFLPGVRKPADDGGSASDRVCFGFGFGFLLLGDFTHLVEIAFEDCRVRDIFGRLGQLQKNDAAAYDQKTENDVDDRGYAAWESLEENRRSDDGGAGEEHIICWGDESGIE